MEVLGRLLSFLTPREAQRCAVLSRHFRANSDVAWRSRSRLALAERPAERPLTSDDFLALLRRDSPGLREVCIADSLLGTAVPLQYVLAALPLGGSGRAALAIIRCSRFCAAANASSVASLVEARATCPALVEVNVLVVLRNVAEAEALCHLAEQWPALRLVRVFWPDAGLRNDAGLAATLTALDAARATLAPRCARPELHLRVHDEASCVVAERTVRAAATNAVVALYGVRHNEPVRETWWSRLADALADGGATDLYTTDESTHACIQPMPLQFR